ncbi:putative phosphatidylglycerol/phosphatidylinositol transfer protein DDB_G0282179 [Abrus precatorius]|uniref:Phosphatidylglycerol/phosphatidylinositol transfer protein DDB_G0282179 n=1 Tax=Abrus precatorius TaxID=3816 RepID=A0A8B8JNV3_ABRPR|nr:putative phosphatidylglycerol/phosphatidylinositol transfer protein DDB_G0282179 [Abrus precatorius]
MAVRSNSSLYFGFCLSSIVLLLSSSHARAQASTFKYCDQNAEYDVKVKGVAILPDPVVRGEPFTFKIAAHTGEPIPSGDLVYQITYAGIESEPATFHHDLCEEAPCPVPAGNFMLTHTELLPTVTPPGTYNVNLTFKDQNGKQLTCIVFPFKIGAESSVSAI